MAGSSTWLRVSTTGLKNTVLPQDALHGVDRHCWNLQTRDARWRCHCGDGRLLDLAAGKYNGAEEHSKNEAHQQRKNQESFSTERTTLNLFLAQGQGFTKNGGHGS